MLRGPVIVLASFAYLGVLFAIAWLADRRAEAGRSVIANPYIYALSLAVYCTSWTFYGSVGRAASSGVGFLPVYLGPTLVVALWWYVWRKVIRISKTYRITSIADFVASRYGKSQGLGGLVTIIAVLGVIPYISLQLKAISSSFTILLSYPEIVMPAKAVARPFFHDNGLYVAVILAAFTILFGTRHLDATERHEGLVAAIAFESVVKLLSFLVVGAFVTFGIFSGFGDIFGLAQQVPSLAPLLTVSSSGGSYATWAFLTLLSMLSIMFLPRQFQISVVENVDENHLAKAIWLFPLYLLLINLFVLPIALGGLMLFAGAVDADTFVLTMPMSHHAEALTLFAFIGGLSAGTGMVIVETIALSTMVCNDLVMPFLLRQRWLRMNEWRDVSWLLLIIRRLAIAAILILGYIYFRAAGEAYALVGIGLISFAAVAQFAPAILGGIYWKGATRSGAIAGLVGGFAVWAYTLALPSFAKSGWLSAGFLQDGLFGVALLRHDGDRTDLSLLHQRSHLGPGPAADLHMATGDHGHPFAGALRVDVVELRACFFLDQHPGDVLRVGFPGSRRRQRFLDQHVLACFERVHRDPIMSLRGSGDHHAFDFIGLQRGSEIQADGNRRVSG